MSEDEVEEKTIKITGDGVSERIYVEHSGMGIAYAGFWIGLGIMLAAAILKGQVILK